MIVDLFAGAGGWDHAARSLGFDPIGIEIDPAACATRAAAGLRTIRADLRDYTAPAVPLDGLIASPPCQIFSQAGTREGADELAEFVGVLDSIDWCGWPDHGPWPADMALLWAVYEWWLRHRPRWVALEQVRPVLPFWEALARRLDLAGWSTWTGILDAVDFGVPQNRERAILLASIDRQVGRPAATHARVPHPVLFGAELRPWVSMADALGWDGVLDQRSGWDGERLTRDSDRPVPMVTGVLGQWVLNRREGERNRERPLDRPAPTLTTSAVDRKWCWDRPATTVTTDARIWPPGHRLNQADIDRLGREQAEARYVGRSGRDAVRVTPAQAAALQSFPPDWPWRGSKTAQARQIGNAVPPLLAVHLLREVTR